VAKLGAVTGTIAAIQIKDLTAASLSSATILAGANLGPTACSAPRPMSTGREAFSP